MSKGILIKNQELSSKSLRNPIDCIENVANQLNSVKGNPAYWGPYGYTSLYPSEITYSIAHAATQATALGEKLKAYSEVLNSGPDELAEIDRQSMNKLISWQDKLSRILSVLKSGAALGNSGVFLSLFTYAVSTSAQTSIFADNDSGNASGEVSAEAKLSFISAYEKANPEKTAEFIDKLEKSGIPQEDQTEIKYLAYSAPEPYASLYLKNVDKYEIKVFDGRKWGSKNSHYNPALLINELNIRLDSSELGEDPKGPYTTFFHESGHAIDDVNCTTGLETGEYEYNGVALYDYIAQDVRNNVREYIISVDSSLTEQEITDIMRSMNLTDDADFKYGARDIGLSDPKLDAIRTQVLDFYHDNEMVGAENEAVCDIYNGVTNNVFTDEKTQEEIDKCISRYGHYDSSYWYDGKILGVSAPNFTGKHNPGQQTGNQAAELWAEFFSAQMTQNEEALASIKEHFPSAYEAMEQMARDLVNK